LEFSQQVYNAPRDYYCCYISFERTHVAEGGPASWNSKMINVRILCGRTNVPLGVNIGAEVARDKDWLF
jgi:hypothetical protein